jgi:Zn finger protein HypA/HybF involved in hydrogenase expression
MKPHQLLTKEEIEAYGDSWCARCYDLEVEKDDGSLICAKCENRLVSVEEMLEFQTAQKGWLGRG